MKMLPKVYQSFLIILFILSSQLAFAQETPTYESVKKLLEYAVTRFDAGDNERAIEYGIRGLADSEKIEDRQFIFNFKNLLGQVYLKDGKHSDAANYFLQIALLGEQINNSQLTAEGYYALADVYSKMKAFKKSAETFKKSADLFRKSKIADGELDALAFVAYNYKLAKENNLAKKYFRDLISLTSQDPFYKASYNEQLMLILEEERNFDEAVVSGNIVYDYKLKNASKAQVLDIAKKMSEYHAELKNGSEALTYANIALSKSPTNVESNRLVGHAMMINGEVEKSINTLKQTLNLVITSPNEKQKSLINKNLAEAYAKKNNYEEAFSFLNKAETIAHDNKLQVLLPDIYQKGNEFAILKGDQSLISKYKAAAKSVTLAETRVNLQNSSLLNKQDEYAREMERELSFAIVKTISKESIKKTQELGIERRNQNIKLRTKSSELEDTKRENEEIKRLIQERDSLMSVVQEQKDLTDLKNEVLQVSVDSITSESFKNLGEKEKTDVLLRQQKKILNQEQEESRQKTILFVVLISGIVLILIIILIAFYKTNQSKKIIKSQNRNLEENKSVINKRNMQLKKSSGYLLRSNNALKKTQNNLKDSLSKEQAMRSELENINSELKNTQVQLIHAEKMSSLGQLTAGIAHEINNPINFVLNSANIIGMNFEDLKQVLEAILKEKDGDKIVEFIGRLDLEEMGDSIEIIEEMLGNLKYGADRVTEIVKGLRTFSRFDEAEIKTVDLHENLDSSLLILHNKYSDNNVTIEKEFDVNLPQIECYPGQLNQVFVNIINNAIDVLTEVEKPTIFIRTKYDDDRVFIEIEDNGSGIPEDLKKKIFDPFFTTKDVGKGTGLGLSISHSIIQQHSGEIKVDSKLGEGTKFIIVLPKNLFNAKEVKQAVTTN